MKGHEELKASRAQLSNALEIAHLGHWVYDVSSDLFTFNDQFYKLFKTTAEKEGGYTMKSADYARKFVHPDDIAIVAKETRKAIDTEGRTLKTYGVNQDITEYKKAEQSLRDSEQKYKLITETIADGGTFWVSMNIAFIRDGKGTIIGLHGVSRDISERKRNEEEILRNEARLEGLLRIAQYKAKSIQSLLDFALEEAIELTDSVLGYNYLYNDQRKEFTLNTWSKGVKGKCGISLTSSSNSALPETPRPTEPIFRV